MRRSLLVLAVLGLVAAGCRRSEKSAPGLSADAPAGPSAVDAPASAGDSADPGPPSPVSPLPSRPLRRSPLRRAALGLVPAGCRRSEKSAPGLSADAPAGPSAVDAPASAGDSADPEPPPPPSGPALVDLHGVAH